MGIPVDLGSLVIGAIIGVIIAACVMHPQWFDFEGEEDK
jgi:phosphate/sulfate permease